MASGIGLHIPGSKRPDDEDEGEEGGEPSLLGPGLLGKLDPTSRKKMDKPVDIQFQDPKVLKAAIRLQRVCRPVNQGPGFLCAMVAASSRPRPGAALPPGPPPRPARRHPTLAPPPPPPPPPPKTATAPERPMAPQFQRAEKPISPPRPTG